MRAFVIEGDPPLGRLRELELPFPLPGEALIRVRLAGICRTDQELLKGYLKFQGVPGHEFVGEVVEVAACSRPEASAWMGKRVVGEINCGCGDCIWCQSGRARHCPARTVLGIHKRNGCFAEFLTLPVANLHLVPEAVSDQQAVFTEPLAAALEIFEQAHLRPGAKTLVVGDGKLGLLISRILQLHGCEVCAVGSHEAKLAVLRDWNIPALQVREFKASGFEVAVEASGSPTGFQLALSALQPRGTLILKSTYHSRLELDEASLVINEITVIGSRCGPFAPALRWLEQGLIPVEALISRTFPRREIETAITYAALPESLKVLVDFTLT